MFAGPNGSGKSLLKACLPPQLIGVYLNPDDIEQGIRDRWLVDIAGLGVVTDAGEILSFFRSSEFLAGAGLRDAACARTFADGSLDFRRVTVDSYLASVTVDFLRQRLLAQRQSLAFETVMSHPGKVAMLAQAQAARHRTYLHYVATDDLAIHVSRVRNRVRLGGHGVPEDRIESRYHRSLALLPESLPTAGMKRVARDLGQGTRTDAQSSPLEKGERLRSWRARPGRNAPWGQRRPCEEPRVNDKRGGFGGISRAGPIGFRKSLVRRLSFARQGLGAGPRLVHSSGCGSICLAIPSRTTASSRP